MISPHQKLLTLPVININPQLKRKHLWAGACDLLLGWVSQPRDLENGHNPTNNFQDHRLTSVCLSVLT